jgi:glutamate dehydrogenase
MALRGQVGIDTLERGLKLAPHSRSQEQLRNYAMQSLRRTQQRLLAQVLARVSDVSDTSDAIGVVALATAAMGLAGNAQPADLEQAILATWATSERCSERRA